MWDDWMEKYEDVCGRPLFQKPSARYYMTDYAQEKRVYEINHKYIAIPIALNKESCFKKAEYVKERYRWLDHEEFNELVKFLHREVIVDEKPKATWHESPRKLTSEEEFENLKKKIRKPVEVKKIKKNWQIEFYDWIDNHPKIMVTILFIISVGLIKLAELVGSFFIGGV